ncbi:unnamed protein product, partial [Ixodes hexagonus]
LLDQWRVVAPKNEGIGSSIFRISDLGVDSSRSRITRKVSPFLRETEHSVWRARELMIPGLLMCAVAMPGPFLQFMKPRYKLIMRMYQGLLYVGFTAYEAYRLIEFVEEFMDDGKTSLICFFHSLINTFLFPFIYIYVARKSQSLGPLLSKWENGYANLKFVPEGTILKPKFLANAYLALTVFLLVFFHTVNGARCCYEVSWNYSNRTFPVKAAVFMGKTAHHYVLQTMYCGLQSLAFSLMFLLWLLYKDFSCEVKTVPTLTIGTISAIREKYRSLCIVTEATADFLNSLLFLFYFRTAFDFMSSVIYYSMQDGRATKLWILAYEGILTFINVFQNTTLAEMSSVLSFETKDTLYVVSKVSAEPQAYKDLLLFLEVYRKRPEAMAGCGVLRVDRALMFKLCGSTVTIVLILFQLDPNLSHKFSL